MALAREMAAEAGQLNGGGGKRAAKGKGKGKGKGRGYDADLPAALDALTLDAKRQLTERMVVQQREYTEEELREFYLGVIRSGMDEGEGGEMKRIGDGGWASARGLEGEKRRVGGVMDMEMEMEEEQVGEVLRGVVTRLGLEMADGVGSASPTSLNGDTNATSYGAGQDGPKEVSIGGEVHAGGQIRHTTRPSLRTAPDINTNNTDVGRQVVGVLERVMASDVFYVQSDQTQEEGAASGTRTSVKLGLMGRQEIRALMHDRVSRA